MSSYKEPSDVLKRLLLPPKNPSLSLSANYQWLVFTQEPPLPSIELLAKPEEKLAGIRFDPELLTPSRLDYATTLVLQHMKTGEKQEVQLPENSEGIRYIRFNPVKSSFVFASKVKNEARLELYQCQLSGDTANNNNDESKQIWTMTKIQLQNHKMNFIQGCAYQFSTDGSKLFIKVVPSTTSSTPPKEPVSTGPAIQQVEKGARKAPGRTYQDLLKNGYDEAKLRYYCTTEVLCIDMTATAKGEEEPTLVPQSKGGHLIQSLNSSPCGRYLLAQLTTKFSYSVPISRFGKDIVLWDLTNNQELKVASIPVNDEIPLSFDACSRHPRGYRFHPCGSGGEDDGDDTTTTIMFVKATDGGDPANDPVDGERDALYCQTIDTDSFTLHEPTKFVGLEWRYSDLDFCESGMAIVEEYRWKDRMERKWILNADGTKLRMLWERSWEDRYNSPGEPLTRRGAKGQYFIVQPTPTSIYLSGAGASSVGDRPFLDVLDFGSEEVKTTRLWRCTAPVEGELDASKEVNGVLPTDRKDIYESLVCVLPDNDSIMISRESKTTPRNYYLSKLGDGGDEAEIQVTQFEHPQPDLLGVTKELVQYKRDDGVELTANLYLPANYDGTPLPTLFWAYPREFKDSKAAGQVKGSKHLFVSAHWASPIHWAAKGWCVFDNFALPVIGEGDAQPNDNFIEQIVSGATAAVEYAVSRGVCDKDRCAVGGHSYGSFMTAHLLSHTSLFSAGIGRSGAFNRTLTPMSFQSEDRSIWEARDTYITMSPLMHVKKMSEQERVGKMLLIHGEADENSGTHPMQSERYFAALKAFGIESRLVMLPHERHSYRARESILHMAYEQEAWLKSLEDK